MQRNLPSLAAREYDLVVVGGGIFGVCAAWDATLRGLSVALLERADFAHATSANSFKIVHGGIRYLQHGDVVRLRESSAERRALLRVAPHLVEPLPIVVPTYGHGARGKELLGVGLLLYDLITRDRNRGLSDPARRIPRPRLLSRREVLELFPGLEPRGLTGGALFHDAQMYNPPRLALAFLRSAVERGAEAANYLEATGFLREGRRIVGVAARDALTGDELEVRGKVVLNAAGPWAERLLEAGARIALEPPSTWSRDACFVVGRPLTGAYGLAVTGRTRDPDALVSRSARHLFLAPWRGRTLVGVWHAVREGPPERVTLTEGELREFLDEVNAGYPALGLTREDVAAVNWGLVLFGRNEPGARNLSYGKRSRLIDHAERHGVEGLVTLIGVRYTTARREAARAVDLVFRKLGSTPPPCTTHSTPVHGGRIADVTAFLQRGPERAPAGLAREAGWALLRNHGSAYPEVLRHVEEDDGLARSLDGSTVIGAEVVHAVREEMALKLTDVVLRRTDLGTAGDPGGGALAACARLMALELGWSPEQAARELEETRALLARAPAPSPVA